MRYLQPLLHETVMGRQQKMRDLTRDRGHGDGGL